MAEDGGSSAMSASRIWGNSVIRAGICRSSDNLTLANVIRVNKACFASATQVLWAVFRGGVEWDDSLKKVTSPDRREIYRNAIRIAADDIAPEMRVSTFIEKFPKISKVMLFDEYWTSSFTWRTDESGKIYAAKCSMDALPIHVDLDDLAGLVKEARETVPTEWDLRVSFTRVYLRDEDEFLELARLAREHDFAIDLMMVPCQRETVSLLHEWLDLLASHSFYKKLHISGLGVASIEDGTEQSTHDEIADIIEGLAEFEQRGVTIDDLSFMSEEAPAQFSWLLQNSDIIRRCSRVSLAWRIPTDEESKALLDMPLPDFSEQPHCASSNHRLRLITVDVDDRYLQDRPDESPEERIERYFSNTRWIEQAARLCLHLCGPSGDISMQLWPDSRGDRAPEDEQEHDPTQNAVSLAARQAFQTIFKRTMLTIVQAHRSTRTPGWRKLERRANHAY